MTDFPDHAPTPEPALSEPGDEARERRFGAGVQLRGSAARGTVINTAWEIGLTALQLIKGFVVASLLTTEDYGIWGILVVSLGTLLLLKQVGISDRYIQQDEGDQQRAFQIAFTLELAACALFAVLLILATPLYALVYGRSELILPGLALAVAVPLFALQAPLWTLYRRLDFARQRRLQAIDPIVGFIVTIALASAGAGYWSFVGGLIAGAVVTAIVAVRTSVHSLGLVWDPEIVKSYLGFSWPLFVAIGATTVTTQVAILVGEWQLGLAGVGAITLASMVSAYTDRVDTIVTQTLYPVICAVQDRTALLHEAFVKSNRLTLMWGLPFGVALFLFTPDLVDFALGEKWRPAVGLLQAYGLIAALNHIGFNWSAFYRARGDTRPMAVVGAAWMVVFLSTAIPGVILYGLDGFAAGMAATTVVMLGLRTYYLEKLFPGFALLRHAVRALAPLAPAVLVVLGLRHGVLSAERTEVTALAELVAYLGVVIGATIVFERALLRELAGYLRGEGGIRSMAAAPSG